MAARSKRRRAPRRQEVRTVSPRSEEPQRDMERDAHHLEYHWQTPVHPRYMAAASFSWQV